MTRDYEKSWRWFSDYAVRSKVFVYGRERKNENASHLLGVLVIKLMTTDSKEHQEQNDASLVYVM